MLLLAVKVRFRSGAAAEAIPVVDGPQNVCLRIGNLTGFDRLSDDDDDAADDKDDTPPCDDDVSCCEFHCDFHC